MRLASGRPSGSAIIIHQNNVELGGRLGAGLKFLRPNTPALLMCSESPSNGVLPFGVDVLCYSKALSHRAAYDLVRFVRYIHAEDELSDHNGPRYKDRRFVEHSTVLVN